MDCGLNSADNDAVSCFVVDGHPDQYIFDPNLEVDKILTSIEFKEVKEARAEEAAPMAAIMAKLGAPAPPAIRGPKKANVIVMAWKGVEYLLMPKAKSGVLTFEMFSKVDDTFRTPLGEITINPATGTFKGSVPIFRPASGPVTP